MTKLICITGLDGVGKSTLVNGLKQQLESVVVSNIWDIMEGGVETVPFRSKRDIDNYLCELTPDSRLLFLAHALRFSIDKIMSSEKKYGILNAYYFKYFATELALGASKNMVNALLNDFPQPDSVFQIQLPIETAAQRKPYFSRYETGLMPKPDKEGFIHFQNKVQQEWDTFNKTSWHILNGDDSPDELIHEVLKTIGTR